MADLSNKLQDYLKNSSKTSGVNGNGSQGNGRSYFSYFTKSPSQETSQISDDASNGWFADAQKDPCLPSLSRKQRVIGFTGCLLMGTFCFSLASLYVPFLVLKARKFALLYSLGSIFIISSFSLLWGPMNHVKHLFSGERLGFTAAYFGTMAATVYFAIWVKSTVFTVIFALLQILALIWYIVSYIPGGKTGLSFFTRVFYSAASRTVSKTLPV